MRQVTVEQVASDLQGVMDIFGPDAFPQQKALYMDKVKVVDEKGEPMTADDIEVVLMPKTAAEDEEEKAAADEDAEDKAEEEEEKAEEDEDKEKSMNKIVIAKSQRKRAASVAAKMSAPAFHQPKVWSRLKNFTDDANGDAVEKATRFGHWLLAGRGNRKSLNWCDRNGIEVKAHTEGVNSAGGFLVPDEFETELINLREKFGVFRKEARVRPMGSDTLRLPRRKDTLSATFVGEATAGTESTQTFESVLLVAKKAMVLTTISSELNEDAFVNLADDVAGEIAYAFAKKEDECGFIGDGSSTYGGITGVQTALEAGTEGKQFFDAAGTVSNASDIEIGDIQNLMALLPEYADTPNCKFYMHKSVWHAGFEEALTSLGGVSASEVVGGFRTPSFLGYPVVFTQTLPTATGIADNTVFALFGDLSLAASFGDRRSTTVQISDSALNAFEQDELAIRGTERFDINVHDIGDSSDSGPIVGLRADNA